VRAAARVSRAASAALEAVGLDPGLAARVQTDTRGLDAAVGALARADGRRGAADLWTRVAERALALQHALAAAAAPERRLELDGAGVLERRFLAPLRVLGDARRGVTIAGRLAVQTPTPLHRELLAAATGDRPLAAWAAGREPAAARDELQAWGLPAQLVAAGPMRRPPSLAPAGARISLRGVRVVELGGLWAAPLAAQLLRELGAEVVKVEAPSRPDGARRGPRSHFLALNAGKRMLALDLRRDAERARLEALLGPETIVIENFTGRVLGNLGLPPERILHTGAALVRMPASRERPDDRALGSLVELAGGLGLEDACAPLPFTDALSGATAALQAVAALCGPRARTVGQIEDVAGALR